jgi:hypothetical protein
LTCPFPVRPNVWQTLDLPFPKASKRLANVTKAIVRQVC